MDLPDPGSILALLKMAEYAISKLPRMKPKEKKQAEESIRAAIAIVESRIEQPTSADVEKYDPKTRAIVAAAGAQIVKRRTTLKQAVGRKSRKTRGMAKGGRAVKKAPAKKAVRKRIK